MAIDARRHAYRVELTSGRTVTALRLLAAPGDTTLLPEHCTVAVTFALGTPYILGVLPDGVAHADADDSLTGVDGHGGEDPVFDARLGANGRDPDGPKDLLPGDHVWKARGGAALAALRGGVATLRGGPFARLDAFGVEDRVRLLAGELRVETWMGYQEVTNEGGRVSYRWRGGTDQVTQTGAGEGRYTLHLDLGHEAGVALFRVTNREKQDLFRVHVSADGRAEVFAAGGVAYHAGDRDGASHERTHHGSRIDVTTRALRREVGGDRATEVGGSDTLAVGGLYEARAGGAINLIATDRFVAQSAGELWLVAGGRARITGDGLTIAPGLTADVVIDAVGADRMRVGRGATSHAVKHEELVQILTPVVQRLNDLSAAFATHVHPPGPGNPGALVNPAYATYGVRLQVNFTPARSQILRLL